MVQVKNIGSVKKWLKYKTEEEFRRALRKSDFVLFCFFLDTFDRNPNNLPVLHRYALFLYSRKKDIAQAEMVRRRG
eukprot:28359-Hanusia_phi.AAC.9